MMILTDQIPDNDNSLLVCYRVIELEVKKEVRSYFKFCANKLMIADDDRRLIKFPSSLAVRFRDEIPFMVLIYVC